MTVSNVALPDLGVGTSDGEEEIADADSEESTDDDEQPPPKSGKMELVDEQEETFIPRMRLLVRGFS